MAGSRLKGPAVQGNLPYRNKPLFLHISNSIISSVGRVPALCPYAYNSNPEFKKKKPKPKNNTNQTKKQTKQKTPPATHNKINKKPNHQTKPTPQTEVVTEYPTL